MFAEVTYVVDIHFDLDNFLWFIVAFLYIQTPTFTETLEFIIASQK